MGEHTRLLEASKLVEMAIMTLLLNAKNSDPLKYQAVKKFQKPI